MTTLQAAITRHCHTENLGGEFCRYLPRDHQREGRAGGKNSLSLPSYSACPVRHAIIFEHFCLDWQKRLEYAVCTSDFSNMEKKFFVFKNVGMCTRLLKFHLLLVRKDACLYGLDR